MPGWRPSTAVAGLLLLQACATAPPQVPGAATKAVTNTSTTPPPHRHGYVGCRTRVCVGGDPRRRQYFDQRRMRYYWFDPDRKRYYWEDGSPYP